jgi:hypothetical protein
MLPTSLHPVGSRAQHRGEIVVGYERPVKTLASQPQIHFPGAKTIFLTRV